MSINSSNEDAPNGFDNRITERNDRVRILSLNNVKPDYVHQGSLPNTPCTVSVISFVLGSGFAVSLATLAWSGNTWWHLSFFLASWCLFHWAEFAVTAGWNEEKCTVDCKSSVSLSAGRNLMYPWRFDSLLVREWFAIPYCPWRSACRIYHHHEFLLKF